MAVPYLQDRIFTHIERGRIYDALLELMPLDRLPESEHRKFARDYTELGVRLGFIVSMQRPVSYTEIGCGLAIPSLTVAKLTSAQGHAFDIRREPLALAERLVHHLNLPVRFEQLDFYVYDPDDRTYLIADKPRNETGRMEMEIVALALKGSHNLSLSPFSRDTSDITMKALCDTYMGAFYAAGYEVESVGLHDGLPFGGVHRLMTAVKT